MSLRLLAGLFLGGLLAPSYADTWCDTKEGSCWYLGTGAALSVLAPSGKSNGWSAQKRNSPGWYIDLGMQFRPRIFAELSYADLGAVDLNNDNPAISRAFPEASIDYKIFSFTSGWYFFEQPRSFNPYVKLGLSSISNRVVGDGDTADLDSTGGVTLMWGGGLEYHRRDTLSIYRLQFDSFDSDALSVSVAWHGYLFGKGNGRSERLPERGPFEPSRATDGASPAPATARTISTETGTSGGPATPPPIVESTALENIASESTSSETNVPEDIVPETVTPEADRPDPETPASRIPFVEEIPVSPLPADNADEKAGDSADTASNKGQVIDRQPGPETFIVNGQDTGLVPIPPVVNVAPEPGLFDVCNTTNRVLDEVRFEPGTAVLSAESILPLIDYGKELLKTPRILISINAHSDVPGSVAENLTLSQDRADEVAKFLIESGLESWQVFTFGYGKQEPLDTSGNTLARERNNRIELSIEKPATCK